MQRVLIIGGSGKQASAAYLPVLLDPSRKDIKLVAIADPVNPTKSKFASKYTDAITSEKTQWVEFKNNINEDLKTLSQYFQKEPFDTLAISCPPLFHEAYVEWGLKNGVDVIVDKPFICQAYQFGDPKAPKELRKAFAKLNKLRESSKHWRHKRQCMVSVPLMRRMAEPYTTILKQIQEVYKVTNQHVTHLLTNRSDGCIRFPEEFDRPGAHGYREGLGSFTQSGYHYLDYMAACVMAAPPKSTILESSVASSFTVGDFRKAPQDIPYAKFLGRKEVKVEKSFIGDNAELDFSVNFRFKKPKVNLPDASINFTFIQSGCSRRVSPAYSVETTHDEGLTNDCIMVIHQGPLQSFHWVVTQDGVSGGRISVIRRVNPLLAKKLKIDQVTITDIELKSDANIKNNQAIFDGLLENFSGKLKKKNFELLDAKYQDITMELYIAAISASVKDYKGKIDLESLNEINAAIKVAK